jgi:hypothetical protein
MTSGSRFIAAILLAGPVFLGLPRGLGSQELPQNQVIISSPELPEAPTPLIEIAAAQPLDLQDPAGPGKSTQPPALDSVLSQDSSLQAAAANSPVADSTSSAPVTATVEPRVTKSKQQKADEQIKAQEHQRVLGIIPSFNTSYVSDAVSLTAKQKVSLAFRSTIDPYTFAIAFIVAGLGEAQGSDNRFGWGPAGYFKRSGAAYLDAFDGTMIGNAFLPIVLHQDPRYFRLGHGKVSHRFFYAVATSFICKHDNTGKWEPNYSNVGGNILSGAISNLYYPDSKNGIAQTFEAGITVTLEGTFGATLQEFWPDISRKVFHKDPTNGLDAQARAADESKKKAKLGQL